MARSKPHFFKVFFPDRSSTQLKLPPAIGEHIEDEASGRVYLKAPSGNIWRVRLVKNSDGFFIFEDGWKEFVEDHSLETGDFLLFRYDRRSRFRVLVFDKTACEKKSAFHAAPRVEEESESGAEESKESRGGVSMEEKEAEDEEEEENKPLVLFRRREIEESLKRTRRSSDPCKKKKKKRNQLLSDPLSPNSITLITPKQECKSYSGSSSSESSKGTLTNRNAKSKPRSSASSIRYSAAIKKYKPIYHSSEVSKSRSIIYKTGASAKSSKNLELVESNEVPRRPRVRTVISQRRPVTDEEVKKAYERAMLFKSDNPFVVTVMHESYVYTSFFMCVPSWFAKGHLPKENAVLTLWDSNDRPWKISYIAYTYHGALSGGWGKFSKANNLELYDVCIFELIKEAELKVHIYRVVEEIKPFVRRDGKHRRRLPLARANNQGQAELVE